jgi:hypothetical protein
MTCITRSLIHNAFNRQGYKKTSKTNTILGCTFEEFKSYLESSDIFFRELCATMGSVSPTYAYEILKGYYEKNEPIGNYSGTNEGLEEVLDNTDYYHNKEMLDYETQEDFNKEVYYVIDNDFNQKNYPDLVGKTFDTPPSYAQVKVIKQGEVELEKESSSDSLINKRGTNAKPNVSYLDEVDELEESSSNSLINKRGTNAKPNASYLKEGQVKQIAYLQDNEANYAFTLLKQDGPEEVIEYLKENNSLQEHKILSEIKNSPLDKTYEKDGYTLSWNSSVGYIKLYSKGIK